MQAFIPIQEATGGSINAGVSQPMPAASPAVHLNYLNL